MFDYTQFQEIMNLLPNIIVLPGIEVDLENGHILVIANNDDNSLFEFNLKCEAISKLIKTNNDRDTAHTRRPSTAETEKYSFWSKPYHWFNKKR